MGCKADAVKSLKKWTAKIVMTAVGFAVIVLPVSGLNYRVTGHFGFLPASGGLNLYIGNNPNYAAAEVRPGRSWQSVIVLPENAGHMNHHWGFSGAACSSVADADHRARKSHPFQNPLSVEVQSELNENVIHQRPAVEFYKYRILPDITEQRTQV